MSHGSAENDYPYVYAVSPKSEASIYLDARLSAGQVQAENIVVRGAAGHRPAGAGLRVIGMRAGNHDAQPASGGLLRIGGPEPRG